MRETVSNNSSIACYSVPPEGVWQVLRWIHAELSEENFAALLADVEPQFRANADLMPMEIVDGGTRIGAAYFVRLCGNVATLGGLRAKRECESQVGFLMQQFQRSLSHAGVAQIQALIDVNNLSSKMVMLNSPFRQATTVRHLWFDLLNFGPTVDTSPSRYTYRPASQFARTEIDELVAATFVGTLDCPDLDGVRSPAEVVSGFLESRAWDANLPWWVLCDNENPIGCALVNKHLQGIYELAYIGLTPSSRGQGLGRALVSFAIEKARQSGGNFLTTAVDTQNWPACRIYDSLGFSEIRELAVWLPKAPRSHQIAAA